MSSGAGLARPRQDKPAWQSDTEAKACQKCATGFSFFIRRHHCRHCGKVLLPLRPFPGALGGATQFSTRCKARSDTWDTWGEVPARCGADAILFVVWSSGFSPPQC
ncbi:hypothetical protein T484DRAFT_1781222 [Baffinella frigidus]|nr:hypothetical protein T484DRAFT_1781222 [Cryptophyta sp. CCMP2293]